MNYLCSLYHLFGWFFLKFSAVGKSGHIAGNLPEHQDKFMIIFCKSQYFPGGKRLVKRNFSGRHPALMTERADQTGSCGNQIAFDIAGVFPAFFRTAFCICIGRQRKGGQISDFAVSGGSSRQGFFVGQLRCFTFPVPFGVLHVNKDHPATENQKECG